MSIFAPTPPPRLLVTEDEGIALPLRSRFDFQGAGVTVTDDAANGQTVIAIPGGSSPAGIFNVRDYGAAGDGSTDDTAAIQAAHSAALGYASGSSVYGKGQVYFPPGDYKITAPIDWNPSDVTRTCVAWQGAGMTQSRICSTAASGTALRVEGGTDDNVGWCQFRDLAIESTSGAASASRGIYLTGPATGAQQYGHYFTLIERCRIAGWGTAIEGRGALVCQIDKCLIEGNGMGVKFLNSPVVGANANVIRDTRIIGYEAALVYSGTCVHIDGGAGLIIDGCDIETFATGVYLGALFDGQNPNVIRDTWMEAGSSFAVDCRASSPLTLIDGCGFGPMGTVLKVRTSAGGLIVRNTHRPIVNNESGSQPVRVENCKDYTLQANAGSNLTATDNF